MVHSFVYGIASSDDTGDQKIRHNKYRAPCGSARCNVASTWLRQLRPLHECIHHPLLAGLVELDRELVAVHCRDVAVAEFLVEHAVAHIVGGDGAGRFRDQFAFNSDRG